MAENKLADLSMDFSIDIIYIIAHQRVSYLRLDDIQHFVLVIYNFCEIDDMQGSRLDFFCLL